MREIKFRVWHGGKMWYPETLTNDGNNTTLMFFNYPKSIGWGLYDDVLGNRLVIGSTNAIFNTPGVLMQFTGLPDRNGKEIFEGDVVNAMEMGIDKDFNKTNEVWSETIGNIYWSEEIAGWAMQSNSLVSGWAPMKHLDVFEILGNIYEHPHLIEKQPA